MTVLNLPPHRARPRRRLLAGVAGVIATIAWIGGAGGSAAAGIAGDHHSPLVAERAAAALTTRDAFALTGTPGDFVAYLAARDATADAVAAEMGLDPLALRAAWAKADGQHQVAVLAALTQLGKPYRYATSDPDVGFDCSGLTAYAWGRAGLDLPNQSGSQIRAAGSRDAFDRRRRRHHAVPGPRVPVAGRGRCAGARVQPGERRRAELLVALGALRRPPGLTPGGGPGRRRSVGAPDASAEPGIDRLSAQERILAQMCGARQAWIGPLESLRLGAALPVRVAMISAQIEIAVSSGRAGAEVEADR